MSNGFILDCAVLGIALILGIGGIRTGLIREGFGLAGILFGVYISTSHAEQVGSLLGRFVLKDSNELLLNLLGFTIGLIVVWSVFILLGRIFSKLFSLSGLGVFDKIMGFIFNVGKILIIFSIIVSCINAIPFLNKKVEGYFKDSYVFSFLIETGNYIANIQAVQNSINKTKKEITEELERQESKN